MTNTLQPIIADLRARLFKTPQFWHKMSSKRVKLLTPLGRWYSKVVTWRASQEPDYTASIPVICIGNFTLGGSGKTPTVQLVAEILKACGKRPAILLRGYGGSAKGPLRIDLTQHNARLVGDEALLHVHIAPTWISRDRVAGAQAIEASGECDCIVMDDGAQNPKLAKNLIINVIDGGVGFGNRKTFPAGPLREDLNPALNRTHAVVVIGEDKLHIDEQLKRHPAMARKPVMTAHIAIAELVPHLYEQPLFAFAGIGRPDKFYSTLRHEGLNVVGTHDFPDHHPYRGSDIKMLSALAAGQNAQLVTTTKDWVRVPAGYQHMVEFLPVKLHVDQIDDLTRLLMSQWH